MLSRITIKSYRPAKGGDYDRYELSNGDVYWLWQKAPFKGTEMALVHVMTNDPTKEVGMVTIEKDIDSCKMEINGMIVVVPITYKQWLNPNKKYFFDKIVKTFLLSQ